MTISSRTKRIVVAMSGGVDSSVCAYLLGRRMKHPTTPASTPLQPQHEIVGLHMSNWEVADEESTSTKETSSTEQRTCEISERDAMDAQSICDQLHITMHRVSFAAEYWTGVFEPFVDSMWNNGRMINPDVGCNSIIKFGAMREYAMTRLDAQWIATGHYARLWDRNRNSRLAYERNELLLKSSSGPTSFHVEENIQPEEEWVYDWGDDAYPLLLASKDLTKDQSYFLCGVSGQSFSNVLFPLGDLEKNISSDDLGAPPTSDQEYAYTQDHISSFTSVREIAQYANLKTASKKDSMGICFIGKRNFPHFISEYLPHSQTPGNFIDIDTGEIVGQHEGSIHLTIGQGAKISGASRKWFIAQKVKSSSDVFVCNNTHHPSLYADELHVKMNEWNWIAGEEPSLLKNGLSIHGLCRTRHLQPLVPCEISWNSMESIVVVRFDRPLRAITPGQTCCVYIANGFICLGGGPIWKHGPTYNDLGFDLPNQLHPAGQNDKSVTC